VLVERFGDDAVASTEHCFGRRQSYRGLPPAQDFLRRFELREGAAILILAISTAGDRLQFVIARSEATKQSWQFKGLPFGIAASLRSSQ
jgi:hypothetical protein